MVVSYVTAFAQQTNRQQRVSREQLAEIEAKHIAQELAFSYAVTEKFVATYCNYKKNIWALGPRQRPNRQGGASEQERLLMRRYAKQDQRPLNKKQRNS